MMNELYMISVLKDTDIVFNNNLHEAKKYTIL